MTEERVCIIRDDPLLELVIATLPKQEVVDGIPTLIEVPDGEVDGMAVAPLQLLEEVEYSYRLRGCPGAVVVEPRSIFSPTRPSGDEGRIRPGRSTGTVTVVVRAVDDGDTLGTGEVEVRSRKLDYLSEYQWMLQRIADEATEAVQSLFAASSLQGFRPDATRRAETLYQRFAFVQAMLGAAQFRTAMQSILRRPHEEVAMVTSRTDLARGTRGGGRLHRELLRPGPRHRPSPSGLPGIPVSAETVELTPTTDTVPNRFVSKALTEWRSLAVAVEVACRRRRTAAARRGVVEAGALAREIDGYLSAGLFRDLSPLRALPSDNMVLQRQEGYRDIYRAYLLTDAASTITWKGGEDVFGAGQRDVALLYECWAFLEVARLISEIEGFTLDRSALFEPTEDGLELRLRRGEASVLRGDGRRHGRDVRLELWYNRLFTGEGLAWSKPMQPDCSLGVTLEGRRESSTKWIHLDAKYRVQHYRQFFEDEGGKRSTTASRPVAEGITKMHAYRDAISRTTGAFVLYPGDGADAETRSEFHELLPGLGAFSLRPGEPGRAVEDGELSLRRFLEDAIDHLASSGTDEHRASYWTDLTYRQRAGRRSGSSTWGDKPAADTTVLLGFVRSPEHLDWIRRERIYNLRADDRTGAVALGSPEMSTDLVLLYDGGDAVAAYRSRSSFTVLNAEQLSALGYPDSPSGRLYCCVALGDAVDVPTAVTATTVAALARAGRPRPRWGAPRVVAVVDLIAPMHGPPEPGSTE
jgi:uncharacterized protein